MCRLCARCDRRERDHGVMVVVTSKKEFNRHAEKSGMRGVLMLLMLILMLLLYLLTASLLNLSACASVFVLLIILILVFFLFFSFRPFHPSSCLSDAKQQPFEHRGGHDDKGAVHPSLGPHGAGGQERVGAFGGGGLRTGQVSSS